MNNSTGLHKKLFAGMGYGIYLIMLTLANISFAADVVPTNNNPVASVVNQTAPENNPSSSISSLPIASSVSTGVGSTSPVTAPKNVPVKMSSSWQVANIIGGLAIILVLIYGLSWFVKRFGQGGFMQNQNMKIISSMPLGTRERLMLVDVGGKQLLLGVTAAQINTLHVFDQPVVVAEKAPLITSDFSQKLMAILQQKSFTPDDSSHKKSNS